jgi:hypothetical protein
MKEFVRQRNTWERLKKALEKEKKSFDESPFDNHDISEKIRYSIMSIDDKIQNLQFRIDNELTDEIIFDLFVEKIGIDKYDKKENFFKEDGVTLNTFSLSFSQNGITFLLSWLPKYSSVHANKIFPLEELFKSKSLSKRRASRRIEKNNAV